MEEVEKKIYGKSRAPTIEEACSEIYCKDEKNCDTKGVVKNIIG